MAIVAETPVGMLGVRVFPDEHGHSREARRRLLDAGTSLSFDVLHFSLTHQPNRIFDQLADHAFDVTTVVANFRVLRRFDFNEWRFGQTGQAASDLGFADTRGSDHQNIFGGNFCTHFVGQLLTAPAVTNRDRDRSLGVVLADDVPIQLFHRLTRREAFYDVLQESDSNCSTTMFVLV